MTSGSLSALNLFLFISFLLSISTANPSHAESTAPSNAMVFLWAEDSQLPGSVSRRALGSGFLISDRGIALTAHHVLSSAVPGERILVSISDKSAFPVPVDETDIQCAAGNHDACVVRVPQGALPRTLGRTFDVECSLLQLGTKLHAIGFVGGSDPFGGLIQPRGEVVGSAMRTALVPTDLDLVPTMSGGPVLNESGRAVAIIKGADQTSHNLTFVTPIAFLRPILESLNIGCDHNDTLKSDDGLNVTAGPKHFAEQFEPNRIGIRPSNLLTTGPRSNCAATSGIVSAQEAYSYVSSIAQQSCTNYVKGFYRPYDTALAVGEAIQYRIFVERSGTTPNDGDGDFNEVSDRGEPLGRPFGIGLDNIPASVSLRNGHVYFFELNTQVNLHRSPGTNKISIRFERDRGTEGVRACSMSNPTSGINYSGNNLRTVTGVLSADDCSRICHSDGLCNAWGWREPGGHSDDNACWIKSAASQPDENDTVVSGVKRCSQ